MKETNLKRMIARNLVQGVKPPREMVGLLPAAGLASRIAPLPCSKEVYPIGFYSLTNGKSLRPKAACVYLLEKMRLAGISKAYIVLRSGKWDIPAYLGNGAMLSMDLGYLITNSSLGPPYTLDQAFPFIKNANVAFGFPDIVFTTADPYRKLIERQLMTGADVVLGLFPAPEPRNVDMVAVGKNGRVRSLKIKPRRTRSLYTWLVAVWSPSFSLFMHNHLVGAMVHHNREGSLPEFSVGHVYQAALDAGLYFESVLFEENSWVDIGTPENLINAVRRCS